VRISLSERLDRERRRRGAPDRLAERLLEIGAHCAALPDIDARSPDEIAGYDDTGMWT
jgi:antitoxin VapB